MATSELISGKLVDANIRADLRKIYLALYDSSIVADIPELAIATDLKRQYVAELVGVLERIDGGDGHALAIVNSEPGENGNDTPHVWYQAGFTSDEEDRKSAEFRFDFYVPAGQAISKETIAEARERFGEDAVRPHDKWVRDAVNEGLASAPRTPRNATNPADLPLCRCGCGFPVSNRKRNYKPGHDAKHAGEVARRIAEVDPTDEDRQTMLGMLPTDALQQKAGDMADRLLRKAAAKTQATRSKMAESGKTVDEVEKVQFVSGEVKVGRWKYPAEQNMTSGAVSYTRKGKVEVASDKVAATFTPKEA